MSKKEKIISPSLCYQLSGKCVQIIKTESYIKNS